MVPLLKKGVMACSRFFKPVGTDPENSQYAGTAGG